MLHKDRYWTKILLGKCDIYLCYERARFLNIEDKLKFWRRFRHLEHLGRTDGRTKIFLTLAILTNICKSTSFINSVYINFYLINTFYYFKYINYLCKYLREHLSRYTYSQLWSNTTYIRRTADHFYYKAIQLEHTL